MKAPSRRVPRLSRGRRLIVGAVGITSIGLAFQGAALAAPGGDDLTGAQSQAIDAGFQVAPKQAATGQPGQRGTADAQPNPYLANGNDLSKADYAAWRAQMAKQGKARATSRSYLASRQSANQATPAAAAAVVYDEEEPEGTAGSNDTLDSAERINAFGTSASKNNVVRILGSKADLPAPSPDALATVAEDNGSITLAGDTGIEGQAAVETTGVLGDGPHGSTPGDNANDFDFYSVDLDAGLSLVADTSGQTTDTVLALYDAEGELVANDDDGGTGFASLLDYKAPEAGTYYLMVGGFSLAGPLPDDPFDSGSGAGGAAKGPYDLAISAQQVDSDNFAVRLRPGDVIGGVAKGGADSLTVYRPDGEQMVGSSGLDASSLYPPSAPLPGGGNTTFAYVAEEAGWYALEVDGAVGSYQVQVEGYRPGAETDQNQKQTVLLDFDGGRVNTGIWGGPGVRELSPFRSFLPKWGLSKSQESAMIDLITREVRDNIRTEVEEGGLNGALNVSVVNTRTHPELEGKKNVSRVVVSGTIDQSGIPTIGIAQFIDPGNYAHEDTALVLLDVLSDPAGDPASLNTYLTEESDTKAFVSQAVGNVTAHEIGHMIGNYHTDNASETVNLMDSGGAGFENLFGVGPDGIGGTADDIDVAFVEDVYTPAEGFTGIEDTENVASWAYPGK